MDADGRGRSPGSSIDLQPDVLLEPSINYHSAPSASDHGMDDLCLLHHHPGCCRTRSRRRHRKSAAHASVSRARRPSVCGQFESASSVLLLPKSGMRLRSAAGPLPPARPSLLGASLGRRWRRRPASSACLCTYSSASAHGSVRKSSPQVESEKPQQFTNINENRL